MRGIISPVFGECRLIIGPQRGSGDVKKLRLITHIFIWTMLSAYSPGFAQQPSSESANAVIGVWASDGYLLPRAITITGVDQSGNLTGCYWGWDQVQRERSIV